MSALPSVCSNLLHENRRNTHRTAAPAVSRRPAHRRGIYDLGGCGLPRRRSSLGAPVDGHQPPTWCRGLGGPAWTRTRSATQTDHHSGENRAALAVRPPHRTRLSYRVVVRPALGPTRRAGVWRPLPPRLPGHVAEAARVHAARAPARAP